MTILMWIGLGYCQAAFSPLLGGEDAFQFCAELGQGWLAGLDFAVETVPKWFRDLFGI